MSSAETALKFINILLNDTVYVFEDSIMQLKKVKELEEEEALGWPSTVAAPPLTLDEAREAKIKELSQARGMARYHLQQTEKTFQFVGYVTDCEEGTVAFLAPAMIDRMASMLNAFVKELVGALTTPYTDQII